MKRFFRHIAHVTGLMAPASEPERYPYHDDDQCPEGQQIKKSGEWQYYAGHSGEEREPCAQCAALNQAAAEQLGICRCVLRIFSMRLYASQGNPFQCRCFYPAYYLLVLGERPG